MSAPNYTIRYGPPITVRDEPHRTFDTLDGWKGEEEISAGDYGIVSEFGTTIELPSIEIAPVFPDGRMQEAHCF